MAIKKKTDEKPDQLPPELERLLKRGFTEQFLRDKYDAIFKETKAETLGYIEGSEEVEITIGKSLKSPFGSIILSEPVRCSIDKDKVIEMIEAGIVSVAQVLSCVSTWKNDELEKTLSSSVFNEVATKTTSQTFTFKATPEFKEKCESEFSKKEVAPVAVSKPAPKPAVEKPVSKPSDGARAAAQRAKAKLAASKKSTASAEDDLDAILGE
jgi:hypothetical protein